MTTKKELLGILSLINQVIYSSELTSENFFKTVTLGQKMMNLALHSYSGDPDDEIMRAVGEIYLLVAEALR